MSKAAPLGLSTKAASRIRRITVITVALLALSAAILSFSGLLKLALDAGFPIELAWLFPIMIDGMIIVGSLGVIASALVGVSTWYMWLLTLLGVSASVVGNIAAAPADLLSQTVHAAPPLVFALSVEGLLRVYRTQAAALIAGEGLDVVDIKIETKEQIHGHEENPTKSNNIKNNNILEERNVDPVTKDSSTVKNITKTQKTNPHSSGNSEKTVKERIAEVLLVEPDISGSEVARRLQVDPSYARKTIKTLKAEMTHNSSQEIEEENSMSIEMGQPVTAVSEYLNNNNDISSSHASTSPEQEPKEDINYSFNDNRY